MQNRLKRLEAVQDVVLEISRLSMSGSDLLSFLKIVHTLVGRIMYAANFYVALYDADRNAIRFVYYVDQRDPPMPEQQWLALESADASPTAWVILNRRPLFMTAQEDAQKTWGSGSRAEHWIGFPLLDHENRALGAMVVQSYDQAQIYSEEDCNLFEIIANHVSAAIRNLQSVDMLERKVRERTTMLESEIEERRKAENLQKALYQIAELSTYSTAYAEKFLHLHDIMNSLMQVPNFMVALYEEERREFVVEYFVDESEAKPMERFPFGVGITSYVAQQKTAKLFNRSDLQQLEQSGQVKILGARSSYSWIGAPLLVDDKLYGVMVIQSYQPELIYSMADLELVAFVASHIATAIARLHANRHLEYTRLQLEQQNHTLNHTLAVLKDAQTELLSQEKLASLGGLVAGIAHEINTPLGICVTAASHLLAELEELQSERAGAPINGSQLEAFLPILEQTLKIIMNNSQRGAALMKSFKQVAVDQSSEQMREFDLRTYLEEVLMSLQPKLKGKPVRIQLDCPAGVLMKTYPGAISQILTNLVMNSLLHAFEQREQGQIWIAITLDADWINFSYSDDGSGLADSVALEKLFEPFYTTKRGQGGSGLGTHMVYNLVTGTLGGNIKACSDPGSGLRYQMRFPRNRVSGASEYSGN